jgi:hypothetical protein
MSEFDLKGSMADFLALTSQSLVKWTTTCEAGGLRAKADVKHASELQP